MKTFAARVLFAILMVLAPFIVVGWESSYEESALVPAVGDEMKEGVRQNLRAAMASSTPSKNIVEVAVGAAPEFETLVAAVTAAGLVDALSGSGPFTVFAPTDASFAALPAGTLDSLLKPENIGTLQDILKYHVVSGKYAKCHLKVGVTYLTTLNGDEIKVEKTRFGRVFVNGIRASLPEIMASNGIIYKINGVLTPPQ